MLITIVSAGTGEGSGTAGYCARLARSLRALGHEVQVVPPGARRQGRVIALERVPGATVWRAGGGWHSDAMRAIGRWPWSVASLQDRVAAHTARHVVANSRMVAQAMRARGIAAQVVRTGVELERFVPAPDEGALLFVGHGWRRKNLAVAVAVAARLGRPLWVAGRDSRRACRLSAARRLLGDRLVDLGPQLDPAAWLPRASLVVHPTRYDPASNLVLEAMASGVPVVTSAMDGSAELLPAGLVARDPMDEEAVLRCCRYGLDGGRALGAALRRVVEAWPDSRNAEHMVRLLNWSDDGTC